MICTSVVHFYKHKILHNIYIASLFFNFLTISFCFLCVCCQKKKCMDDGNIQGPLKPLFDLRSKQLVRRSFSFFCSGSGSNM